MIKKTEKKEITHPSPKKPQNKNISYFLKKKPIFFFNPKCVYHDNCIRTCT